MDPNSKPPRVFVSYSWTSDEYQRWIVNLAERLAGDGVHVTLDAWDLAPGQDKFVFMESMVTDPEVKHVLLMCDPRYAEKADSRHGGVGTETQIVSGEVYAKADQKKFIPVITKRKEDGGEPLPAYLSSRIYVDLSDDGKFAEEYEKLLRLIFDKPARKRPLIGKPPTFLSTIDAISPRTHLLRQSLVPTAVLSSRSTSSLNRLRQSLLSDLAAQRLLAVPDGAIDEVISSKIQELKGPRDVTVEWFRQLIESESDQAVIDELVSFFEQLITISGWPLELPAWSRWQADHLSFFAREVWLYAIAILIEARRWEVVKGLLSTTLCAMDDRVFRPVGYLKLECYLVSLEEIGNKKRERQRISVLADLVKERADDPQISFELLMQADFLLCLRGIVSNTTSTSPPWFPRTLVYAIYRREPFPIFVRWRVGQLLSAIPAILGVPSRETIIKNLISAGSKALARFSFDHSPLDFPRLTDFHGM